MEPLCVGQSGLINLQNALSDLEEVADAFRDWSSDPNLSPIDLLSADAPGNSRRLEMMECLAELLRERRADPLIESSIETGERFQVVRHHAEGGLGTVSVAIDRELNREVALKQILDRHADDPTRRDRFLIEAEITGGLEHPGIVPVYSLGHSDDGRPFYAMRLIRGETLAEAIDWFHVEARSPDPAGWGLDLRKLLRRFIDVCNAIEYAHGRGILHRDLKPSNVMLGKHGETLVLDWGLAKPIGGTENDEDEEGLLLPSSGGSDTLAGSAVGTPSFMSPEQAAGSRGSIGPRSDVYSLGATLYCLLTGRTPFDSAESDQILQDVREGKFARPGQVNSRVPRPLESICLKAMALDPDDRYGSTRELADDIECWMADEPISALSEPPVRRLGRWARKRRTTVNAVLAGVMVALGVVLTVQSRANNHLQRANEAATQINQDLLDANRREKRTNDELQAMGRRDRARFEEALAAFRIVPDDVTDDHKHRESELAEIRSGLPPEVIRFDQKLDNRIDRMLHHDSPQDAVPGETSFNDLTHSHH